MAVIDPKTYLWENICLLMKAEDPAVDFVQKTIKVGRGTVQRIKEKSTSVGTDKLMEIAKNLGVEPWQLLMPNLKAYLESGKKLPAPKLPTGPSATMEEAKAIVNALVMSFSALDQDGRGTAAMLLERLVGTPGSESSARALAMLLATGVPDSALEHLSAAHKTGELASTGKRGRL